MVLQPLLKVGENISRFHITVILQIFAGVARDQAYLPFIPLGITYGAEEIFLPESDEGTSDAIGIPVGFPFGESTQETFYVIFTYF